MAFQYREVKRKADKGDLVKSLVDRLDIFHKGEILTVAYRQDDSYSNGVGFHRWQILKDDEYVVLEPIESTDTEDRITQLETRVAKLEAKLAMKREHDDLFDATRYAFNQVRTSLKPKQYTRAEVIEMAKEDVEWLMGQSLFMFQKLDFVVNRKKRTVVVLGYGWLGSKPSKRGISHCAPDDCFNVHLGKAIALRRALGLDVPDYYVNAPKPTEAQMGDIIIIAELVGDKASGENYNRSTVIIDDSHDFGGDSQ